MKNQAGIMFAQAAHRESNGRRQGLDAPIHARAGREGSASALLSDGYTALAFLIGLVLWIVTAAVLFSFLHVWLAVHREGGLTEAVPRVEIQAVLDVGTPTGATLRPSTGQPGRECQSTPAVARHEENATC